jgi:hypothetical protein
MNDHEAITVALLYASLALVGPFTVSMLLRWSESNDAMSLAREIGAALEGVAK